MSAQELLKTAGDTLAILPRLYEDLAQPSVQKVGKALGTVFGLCNTVVLPVRLANELALLYYKKHINSYKEKLNEIPNEEICEVQPEIGVPIMDRFSIHYQLQYCRTLY